jgi:hypothetical protein
MRAASFAPVARSVLMESIDFLEFATVFESV